MLCPVIIILKYNLPLFYKKQENALVLKEYSSNIFTSYNLDLLVLNVSRKDSYFSVFIISF